MQVTRLFLIALIITACSFVGFTAPADARSKKEKYASIVIDADTGMILHQRHADKSRHPASLTKIMTIYMAFDALESGRLSLKDRVRISRHAASQVPSKLGLPAGSSISVKDAISALVTKSANDVAVALGEKIAGTESAFARRMTTKARELGMSATRFKNASGLHHRHQISTARDMARLARAVLHDYPQYYRYFSMRSFTYKGRTYNNHNRLMRSYRGMDGIKTGYINASGFNLVASARQDGRRIVGVVFGGRTSKTRNAHMKALLDNGFNKLRKLKRKGPVVAAIQKPPRKPYSAQPVKVATISTPSRAPVYDMEEALGQGDIEADIARRVETGLMVMAVHTDQNLSINGIGRFNRSVIVEPVAGRVPAPAPITTPEPVIHTPRRSSNGMMLPQRKPSIGAFQKNSVSLTTQKQGDWAVQIGALKSRAQTDVMIREALDKLPSVLQHGQAVIAPLRTGSGMMFRGRLSGYSEKQARAACKVLQNCLVITPQ